MLEDVISGLPKALEISPIRTVDHIFKLGEYRLKKN